MKTSIFKLIVTLSFLYISSGLSAQTCDTYIMFKKGVTYEMETFNGKDKLQNRMVYTVKEVTTNAGGVSAVLHTTTYDSKNKVQDERDMTVTCSKEKLSIDMANVFKSMQQNGNANSMEMTLEGSVLDIPQNMAVGQALPEQITTMKMLDKASQAEIMNMHMTTKNKKVEAKESITTPAGTYECFKITYETLIESKMTMMNMKLPTYLFNGILYFNKEIGMVKTVELDKDGKSIKSYSMVTKVTR